MNITLPEWARRNGIPLITAKKMIKENAMSIIGIVINTTKRGTDYLIPESYIPPIINTISCEVCGKKFQQIAERHLKLHNLTMEEYRKEYPAAILITKEVGERIAAKKFGHTISEVAKKAISKANTGNKYNLGKTKSAETRLKISKSKTGKKLSAKHIAAIAAGRQDSKHSSETLDKMRDVHANRSSEEKSNISKKIEQTSMKRYGVSNPAKSQAVIAKAKATHEIRYGGWGATNSEIKAKIKNTQDLIYGGHPSKNELVKAKTIATNLERYGEQSAMKIARAAYSEQTGYDNPFQNPEVKDKIKETCLAIFGTYHPMSNLTVKEQRRLSNVKVYGRNQPNQSHISDETFSMLNDPESLAEEISKYSVHEISERHQIRYDLVLKYCKKNGIVLPASSYETAILAYLRSLGIQNIKQNDRNLIAPLELDFVLDDYNLAIEFCGLYWHSEKSTNNKIGKDKNYHLTKLELVEKRGYKLITIFEDEWLANREIIETRLRHILGLNERGVGARKLVLKTIPFKTAELFFDQYHIQGSVAGSIYYGAYDDEELVAAMSFGKARAAMGRNSGAPELLRFATNGKAYAGVASRLFKKFVNEHPEVEEIISYADRRWSWGSLYNALGFVASAPSRPNYWYMKNYIVREYRYNYRKSEIINLVENGSAKTEFEIMRELGYDKIWDCGNLKFIWKK